MVRQFSVLEEARKHPGITAGTLAVAMTAAIATIILSQRTGPTRYRLLKDRMDPRGWFDAEALRHRFEDISRGLTDGAHDLSLRAGELGDDAREAADGWVRRGRKAVSERNRRRYVKAARDYADRAGHRARQAADEAGQYARDHAGEGGALLAVATLAALVGAVVLESRRPNSRVRRIAKF